MTSNAGLPDPLPIPRLTGPVRASVRVPGSKSITNRALLCAGLAAGRSELTGALAADDTAAMRESIARLGANIGGDFGSGLTIDGVSGRIVSGPVTIDAKKSGTTSRFMAASFAVGDGSYTLDGHEQLRARPFGDLIDALRLLGIPVDATRAEFLPLTVHAGNHLARSVELGADVSSQFASGLLLAAPCFPDGLELDLVGPVVSQPYLDLTVSVMQAFGATVELDSSGQRYRVEPSGYQGTEFEIEPDASTASYFFAIGALANGSVEVQGISSASAQGDARFVDALAAMGAEVSESPSGIRVGSSASHGIEIDMRHISDTAPTLAAVAGCVASPTSITGIGFIRQKESDRIAAMVDGMKLLGLTATENEDGLTVDGSGDTHAAVIDVRDDHRIAMAFTVVGLIRGGVSIANPGCVAKTFPGFFESVFAIVSSAGMDASETRKSDADYAGTVIAIDGPSGSGKSTVARALAERLGTEYLDTGAMYRAVAFGALDRGVDLNDAQAVAALTKDLDLQFSTEAVSVDGVDATAGIRGHDVTRAVSVVAAIAEVRAELQLRQREWAAANNGGVIEGRDIGTVVFPDAHLKVFLTADADVRASRRAKEVTNLDYETVAADLLRRDTADSTRKHNPLEKASDAIEIETASLTINGVVDHIIDLLNER